MNDFPKYKEVLDYITEFKPMLILEYGAGKTTFDIDKLLDELNYGGSIVAFEDNKEFYDIAVEAGWNYKNSIKHVEIRSISDDHFKIPNDLYEYVHDYEEFKNVDLVIMDGPDLSRFDPYPFSIINLKKLVELKGEEIPFFIDGRTGYNIYYKEHLGYKTNIAQAPKI